MEEDKDRKTSVSPSLINSAIPKKRLGKAVVFGEVKKAYKKQFDKNIILFDLNLYDNDYSVSLFTDSILKEWLLVFNKKYVNNVSPLVLKMFKGFLVTFKYNEYEFKKIREFFGYEVRGKGSFKDLIGDINQNIIAHDPTFGMDLDSRKNALNNQSNTNEIDKIYFRSFIRYTKINPVTGKINTRSDFNSWKIQQILPDLVWEQVKNDPNISVAFTDVGKYSNLNDENESIKEEIKKKLNDL